jgi:hypothetical protein
VLDQRDQAGEAIDDAASPETGGVEETFFGRTLGD